MRRRRRPRLRAGRVEVGGCLTELFLLVPVGCVGVYILIGATRLLGVEFFPGSKLFVGERLKLVDVG